MDYFRVDVQYLQKTYVVIAANDLDEARKIIDESVIPGTELFQVNGVRVLTDEEKMMLIQARTIETPDGVDSLDEVQPEKPTLQ